MIAAAAQSGWNRLGVQLLIVVAALAAVIGVRTAQLKSKQIQVPAPAMLAIDEQAAAARLSAAVKLRTVSYQEPGKTDAAAFEALHRHLEASFPRAHAELKREKVAELSLLYTWQGSDPSLPPVLLLGHQDVVPIEPGTESSWQHEPFSGDIAEGFIWGRGTLDDKVAVLGLLEAVEALLAQGVKPRRTVMLAFGHDEEIGGRGAQALAALLRERGQQAHLILDEGSVVVKDVVAGIDAPLVALGIAEKGYLSVQLSAEGPAGHSSMPPREGAVERLAAAVTRLKQRPMPASISGPLEQQLDHLAPEMPLSLRVALANRWLLGGLIQSRFDAAPATRAQLRTTAAFTMLDGSVKENVLPQHARAVINFRIKPGDSVASVMQHVSAVVDDPHIQVSALPPGGSEPTPVARTEGPAYEALRRSIGEMFPEAIFAPSLVVATTDARHYTGLSDSIYRLLPVTFTGADLKRLHGTNERISVAAYARAIRFYARLIRNTAGE